MHCTECSAIALFGVSLHCIAHTPAALHCEMQLHYFCMDNQEAHMWRDVDLVQVLLDQQGLEEGRWVGQTRHQGGVSRKAIAIVGKDGSTNLACTSLH